MRVRSVFTSAFSGALIVVAQCASANVIVCRSQCTTDHQSGAGQCGDKACVARCASIFNACIKKCDEGAKIR